MCPRLSICFLSIKFGSMHETLISYFDNAMYTHVNDNGTRVNGRGARVIDMGTNVIDMAALVKSKVATDCIQRHDYTCEHVANILRI